MRKKKLSVWKHQATKTNYKLPSVLWTHRQKPDVGTINTITLELTAETCRFQPKRQCFTSPCRCLTFQVSLCYHFVFQRTSGNAKAESFSASPASEHICSTVQLCKTLENSFRCQQIAGSRLKGFNLSAARCMVRAFPGTTVLFMDPSRPPPRWPSLTAPPIAAEPQNNALWPSPSLSQNNKIYSVARLIDLLSK